MDRIILILKHYTKQKGMVKKMRGKSFKVLVSAVLVQAVLASGSAFAATSISAITASEGLVTVSGSTDTGEALTYEVYGERVETPRISDIVGFGEIYLPVGGDFTLKFGLKETGNYKVRISDGYEKLIGEFAYASAEDRAAFIDSINEILKKSDTAASALDSALTAEENRAVVETIGIAADEYTAYDNAVKTAICERIAKDGKDKAMTEKDFLELYTNAEALARINKGSEEIAKETVKSLNFTFENMQHSSIKSAEKQVWIEQAVVKNAPFTSIEEVEKMYNKVSALYAINNAKVSNIESKLNDYAAILEITGESEYLGYKDAASSAINKILVESLADTEPQTVALLLEVLGETSGVTVSGSSGGGSSSGSSSSSGGGGGGGGYASMSGSNASVKQEFAIGGVSGSSEGEKTEAKPMAVFNDVSQSHWAYSAVAALYSEGIISGYGDGSFLPDRTVTREEFVKMIIAAFKMEDENAKSHFHDVFDSDWFYPYVSAAFEKGIVMGDHLGLFGVNADITRQDAAVIAARAMRTAGKTLESVREYSGFGDEESVSDYAKEDVKALYSAGKINGTDKGTFDPRRFCTRAEAAAIIYGISR